MEAAKSSRGGRKPKVDGQRFMVNIRLSAEERAKLLNMADELGQANKSKLIRSCIFNREISVVKVDGSLCKIIEWLTKIHAQYRLVGVNYNQTVKRINTCFGENRAALLLKNLEAYTQHLSALSEQVAAVAQKQKEKYYKSDDSQDKSKQ
jgi:hypothetical protein